MFVQIADAEREKIGTQPARFVDKAMSQAILTSLVLGIFILLPHHNGIFTCPIIPVFD